MESQALQDALEEWIALARAIDAHVDVLDAHRRAGIDVDDHPPVAVSLVGDRRFHLRLVVTEGAQRRVHLPLHAIVQPLDGVGVQIHTALAITLETQIGEHVVAHVILDPTHFHGDSGGVHDRPGEQA